MYNDTINLKYVHVCYRYIMPEIFLLYICVLVVHSIVILSTYNESSCVYMGLYEIVQIETRVFNLQFLLLSLMRNFILI